ncbi:MAG: hypothetical protein K2K12_03670, partial [Clostridia bacterium]|nr:hypothetical protein [Clostridia bacterium]
MEEQQQDELRIGEILSIIWKHIIWILVVSLIAAVACGIFVQYSVSPSKRNYQLSFTFEYPYQYTVDKDGNTTNNLQYPDGTAFRIESVIYTDRLNAAKETDKEAFESIDTEKMVSKKKISISASSSNVYTITAASSCFKDKEQATEFLKAVCNVSGKAVIENAQRKDCYSKLLNYDTADTTEKKLDILKTRQSDILSTYSRYLGYYRNFTHTFGEGEESQKKTLEACYYEAAAVNIDKMIQIFDWENELEKNKKAIERLEEVKPESSTESDETLDAYHQKIVEYTVRNSNIETELERTYPVFGYTGETGQFINDGLFTSKLAELKTAIDTQTDTLNMIITELYKSTTKFNFEQSSVLVTGGANMFVYAALVFIVVFVLASFVFCALDISRKRKGAAAKASEEQELHEVAAPEETQMLEEPHAEELQEVEEATPEEVKPEEPTP